MGDGVELLGDHQAPRVLLLARTIFVLHSGSARNAASVLIIATRLLEDVLALNLIPVLHITNCVSGACVTGLGV